MNRKTLIFWSLFTAIAVTRVFFSFFHSPPNIGDCLKKTVTGAGTIEEEPTFSDSGQTLVVNVEKMSVEGLECPVGILIRMKTKLYPRFSYSDGITFTGKLGQPFNFSSNKAAANSRTFDFRGYLAKDDIYYEIKSAQTCIANNAVAEPPTVAASDKCRLGASAPTKTLRRGEEGGVSAVEFITSILYELKRNFVNNLERTLGEPHAALAAGLVVGEKSALGKDLLNDFRIVGLIHIVVLSGFNITVVADAIKRVLSFLPRVWGIVLGGLGIALFGILVGGGSTVVRSCFMAGIALSADLIRRDYSVIRALIFAGLVMIIQSPMILLHDPSFQLSFLATLGLIFLASPIEKKLTIITEKFGLRGIVASTFATQIFVSPYILYMMGQLSIIGVFANILVLPFIPVTMLFVFLTGAAGFVSTTISQVFAWGSHILLTYELFIVQNFAKIPFAAVFVPAFSFWFVVAFYSLFFICYFWLQHRNISQPRSNSS